MYSKETKQTAQRLREQGFSYECISEKIGVQKSTLSLWFRDIGLHQKIKIEDVTINSQKIIVSRLRFDKALSLKEARSFAREAVQGMSKRDIFILGIGIYIGEGSKSNNIIRIVNSDSRIIRFSIKWFKEVFGLTAKNFKVRLHVYPDIDQDRALHYWTKALDLGIDAFQTPYVDRRMNKKRNREGILLYGTAHLSVVSNGDKRFGVLLHRKILATIDRVLDLRD